MSFRRALLIAAAGGAVMALSGAPRDVPALGFVGPAVLAWLLGELGLREQRADTRTVRRAVLIGWAFGTGANAVALRFTVGLLVDFGHFPHAAALLVSLLLWAAQGLVYALAAGLCGALASRTPLRPWMTLPPCIVVAEHVVPMLFPWRLAATQVPWIEMIQCVELGGEPLLSFAVAAVGCGVTGALVESDRRVRVAGALAAAAALIVPLGYGFARLPSVRRELAAAQVVRIGLVQPDIGIEQKGHEELAWVQLVTLRRMTRDLERRGADLVVWPETAAPFSVRRTARGEPDAPWGIVHDGVRGPILVGVVTWGSVVRKYNSALLVRRDRTYEGPSDKIELIPFGEHVPVHGALSTLLRLVWPDAPFRGWFERARGFSAGERPRLLRVEAARPGGPAFRVGVMICYEDILPAMGLAVMRAQGGPPDLLANLTNDAWFGDGDEPHLHLALSRFRAVELRRDLVRAVNTGVSAHVSATGEVLVRTGTFETAMPLVEARLLHGTTPWASFGDWCPLACAIMLVLLAVAGVVARTTALGNAPGGQD